MKVLFICGSAQPQRCGVGDYSRRLAGELIRQGHEACIVSLMDAEILSSVVETQMDVNTSVTVFRMPYSNGYIRNCKEAKSFVDNFSPDWISLQYVPFSFHSIGLPVGLARHLKLLTGTRHLHVMFHELWVGINGFVNLKIKAWGKMQLELILSLVKHLNPDIVHTQTELYQTMLSRHGIPSRLLPLFSNIPLETDLLNINEDKLSDKEKNFISLVLFGSIHKNAPVQQFASELKCYSEKISKNIKLTILGRSGVEAERWSYEFKNLNMEVISTGEQTDFNISRILGEADYGITTSAFDILEKSGSVAAMVEHRLNVICVAAGVSKNKIQDSHRIKGLFSYSAGNLEDFFDSKPDLSLKPFFCSLKETSTSLIDSFNDSVLTR
jgi:hypothetical protein